MLFLFYFVLFNRDMYVNSELNYHFRILFCSESAKQKELIDDNYRQVSDQSSIVIIMNREINWRELDTCQNKRRYNIYLLYD